MSRRLKVLLLGAGAMAVKHIEAFRRLADVEIVALANRGAQRGKAACERYAIPNRYEDYEKAIDECEADIASICLPTFLHSPLAVRAMSRGMHVLSEKPIALSVEGAEAMIDAAERYGRKLSVIFNRRFNTVYDALLPRLETIGTPMVYNSQDMRSIRSKIAMHSRSQNGGPVVDCSVHDFDMLLHLFGKARRVFATGDVFGRNQPSLAGISDHAIDTAHINVEFEDGHRAYLLYAWGFPPGPDYWQAREFMGPEGIVRMMGEFGEVLHHYRADGSLWTQSGLLENGHAVIAEQFVQAVASGGPLPVSGEEALAALQVALAALRSIASGKVERVP